MLSWHIIKKMVYWRNSYGLRLGWHLDYFYNHHNNYFVVLLIQFLLIRSKPILNYVRLQPRSAKTWFIFLHKKKHLEGCYSLPYIKPILLIRSIMEMSQRL